MSPQLTLDLEVHPTPVKVMSEAYQKLLAEATSATDETESIRILAKILVDEGGKDFVSSLDPKDGETCIKILDHGLSGHRLSRAEDKTFSITLWKLAAAHRRLPDSVTIKEKLEISDERRSGSESNDTRMGKHNGNLVAVTTRAISPKNNPDWIRQGFCKEVILWRKLSHPNILKLFGAYGDMEKGPLATVSEWVAGGNIVEYIKHNSVNRLELLHGAAQGLKYLHDEGIVHGDPTGQNILVTNDAPPRACLSGFACMTIIPDSGEPIPFDVQLGHGTVEFKSPERFNPQRFDTQYPLVTREADIYAFAMTIYQVLTGEVPFNDLQEVEVIESVVNGLRPAKPQDASSIGFFDSLWDFIQLCWDGDRTRRPTAAEVVGHLAEAATNWDTLMPPATATPAQGPAKIDSDPMIRLETREDQRVLDPSVDAPPALAAGPSGTAPHTAENDHNASSGVLRRLGKAFRTVFTTVRDRATRGRARNARAPDQPAGDTHNIEGGPPSPLLHARCC